MSAPVNRVTLAQRAIRSEDALFQDVGGEAVLLDLASERYFGLDPVGTRIWELLGQDQSLEAVAATLCAEYEGEPDRIRKMLSSDQYKLYNLIWQRFVASQMANAVYNTLRVDIDAGPEPKNKPYHFRVSGSTIRFLGFLALYEEARDEDAALDADDGRILPELTAGELLNLLRLFPEQHFTQPPPRFTEARLVRTLEELGIGRPSTYAPTLDTIQKRGYVTLDAKRFIPTELGEIVHSLVLEFFHGPTIDELIDPFRLGVLYGIVGWLGALWFGCLFGRGGGFGDNAFELWYA